MFNAKVSGEAIIVSQINSVVKGYSAKCPHLGLPLGKGTIRDNTIACPFHGATFKLATDNPIKWVHHAVGIPLAKWTHKLVVLGKNPCALTHFNATEHDEKIFVSVKEQYIPMNK